MASGYMSKDRAATTDDWIQHRAETCQRGNACIPHMVPPRDLGYMALAFHVDGFQPFVSVASSVHVSQAYVKLGNYLYGKTVSASF